MNKEKVKVKAELISALINYNADNSEYNLLFYLRRLVCFLDDELGVEHGEVIYGLLPLIGSNKLIAKVLTAK